MKSAEQQREAQEAHPVLRADTAAIMQQQADASPRDSNPGDQTQGEEGDTTQTQVGGQLGGAGVQEDVE
jgi:hypothetical protein